MSIDEAAYQHALEMNKGKTFSIEGGADECFRYFLSCYEAAKTKEQPVQYGYDPGTPDGDMPALTFRKGDQVTCILYGQDARVVAAFIKDLAEAQPERESGNQPEKPVSWQPIETAPRDGTPVLLADADGWVGEGQWEADEGWYQANCHSTDYVERNVYPTDWQPLPAAPDNRRRG